MKEAINTTNAPAPVGPYSQSIASNGTLYVSGQVALDSATGEMIQDSIEIETTRVMDNLGAVLTAAGAGFADVVKCSVFVSDIGNFGRINAIYAKYFEGLVPPARELVEVSRLPKEANIEISCIAELPQK